jgi:hypothetical protein
MQPLPITMPSLAFISYRRDDTGPVAQVFYLRLKELFGSGQLFMDASGATFTAP